MLFSYVQSRRFLSKVRNEALRKHGAQSRTQNEPNRARSIDAINKKEILPITFLWCCFGRHEAY